MKEPQESLDQTLRTTAEDKTEGTEVPCDHREVEPLIPHTLDHVPTYTFM